MKGEVRNMVADLRVISHVGRDLLASAALFKTEAAAVWEYVANGLEYVERGTPPVVSVAVNTKDRTITVTDNGRGMSDEDLQHYFTMHGENRDRRAGRPGRGKFGTGKSAAFGIARRLRIQTVHDGLYNEVLLTRAAIDQSDGTAIPIEWVVSNRPTDAPNGTTVTIDGSLLDRIDAASIIQYVERHLGAFPGAQVAVNSHVCEYREPQVANAYTFTPSEKQAAAIGQVTLTIKVAQAPLEPLQQGVTVTAGAGNVVGIERAGLERKEFGNYLFGDVDVPKLEEPCDIMPYDPTRNLELNPNHPVVRVLLGFIGAKMEEVRGELVKREQDRRSSAQAKALEQESAKIAELLNKDFRDQELRLREIQRAVRRASAGPAPASGSGGSDGEGEQRFAAGTQQPGTRASANGSGGARPGAGNGGTNLGGSAGTPDPAGVDPLSATNKAGKAKPAPAQGGFAVEYRPLGVDEERSRYDHESMTILINPDHPVLAAALEKGGVNDVAFRRLSYEIAFSEYAIAMGYEKAIEDPEMPADDLLYEVRSTLNRIARAAANLYR